MIKGLQVSATGMLFARVFSSANLKKPFVFLLPALGFLLFGCSIPTLEKPECVEAKDHVKQFYSFHFGSEIKPGAESLRAREKYLSPRLFDALSKQDSTARDYFTQSEEYPRAFRVGGCSLEAPDRTVFEVLLFWRDGTDSRQMKILVEAVRGPDRWLIDKVEEKR
jgi:hypothetical protein